MRSVMRWWTTIACVTLSVLAAGTEARAILLHDYELNGTFADSLGGPPMVSGGGTLGATGYTFAAGQGPSLSNALPMPGSYSIEMGFTIDSTSGYRKLIDFKDLTSDNGLYNYSTELYFYYFSEGPSGAFSAGVPVVLRLTRNATTKEVVGYVNDVEQIRFTDSGDDGVFSAANNIIHFFQDDTTTGGRESTSGFLDFVRISAGPQSSAAAPMMDGPWAAVLGIVLLVGGAMRVQRRRPRA